MQANIYRIEDNEANIRKLMKDDVALRLRLGQDEARITENSVRISAQASEEDSTNDLLMRRINRIEDNVEANKVAHEVDVAFLQDEMERLTIALNHLRDQTMGEPSGCCQE